jgi:hypothetical protein
MAREARRLGELRSGVQTVSSAERRLAILLRIGGAVMLCAALAIVLPTRSMVAIHAWLGMGALPQGGIVEYLTRSASALYAFHGGLLLVLAQDVRRYARVISFLGVANVALGGVLLAVDLYAEMPWYWTAGEGPCVVAIGILLLVLVRAIPGRA